MSAKESGGVAWTPLALAAFLFAMLAALTWNRALQDDTFISLVYARNLVRGAGLVYNAGEPPVEGYTNFLWTLIAAGGMKLGIEPTVLVRLLAVGSGLVLLVLTERLARRLGAGPGIAAGAALLLASRRAFVLEAVGGLETLFFALLVAAALLPRLAERRTKTGDAGAGLAAGLAGLTRPEGILVFGLLELGELLTALRTRSLGAALRRAPARWIPFGLLVGAHLAFRWTTYGDLVPNTFHAKVGGGAAGVGDGLHYVRWCLLLFGPLLFALPYLLAPVRPRSRATLPCLLLSTGYVLYVVSVGGDFKPTARFLLPVMAIWCALAAAALERAGARLPGRARLAAPVALGVLGVLSAANELRLNEWVPDRELRNEQLRAVGETLRDTLPEEAWIAVSNAGAIPYYADRRTIDMLGLSDAHIARTEVTSSAGSGAGTMIGHEKGDGDYVLDRAPEAIFFLRLDVSPIPLAEQTDPLAILAPLAFGRSEREILSDPRLERDYALVSRKLPGELGYANFFRRRAEASAGASNAYGEAQDLHDALRERREERGEFGAAGRWRPARTGADELDPEQLEAIRDLEAVGYASGSVEADSAAGVTRHDRERAQPGFNLVTSGHAPEASLLDMDGEVLHTWHREFFDVWPEFPPENVIPGFEFWRRVHLFPNGDLLAIHEGLGLVKLDEHSQVLWSVGNGAHHDLEVRPDGDIYVLTRIAHVVPRMNARQPILEDFITILGADGQEKRRVSLLECFETSRYWNRDAYGRLEGDVLHTNSLVVLDGRMANRMPAFAAGNVLVSFRTTSTIGVVDLNAEELVWAAAGGFAGQHDPSPVPGARLLLFDNLGLGQRSRAVELDPRTLEILWRYRGTAEDPLFSETCGTAARLSNGNTLITESDNGRALEVTREGDVVWEYRSPHRAGPGNRYVATLFEVIRLAEGFPLDWLDD